MKKVLFMFLIVFLASVSSRRRPPTYENEFNQMMRLFSGQFFSALMRNHSREDVNNVIFSPFSIYQALGMVLAGAAGNTTTELLRTMNLLNLTQKGRYSLRQSRIHSLMTLMHKNAAEQSTRNKLLVANAMFINRNYLVFSTFLGTLQYKYKAYFKDLDFSNEEESVDAINDWVSKRTQGKINELVENIDPLTELILVNAIYFNASWKKPFEERKKPIDFTLWYNDEKAKRVAMTADIKVRFGFDGPKNTFHIAIPYASATNITHTYLIVAMPNTADDFHAYAETIEETLGRLRIDDLNQQTMSLTIPKFEINTNVDVKKILMQMGLDILFDTQCDLSGISNQELHVSKFDHKAYINVNEKGTEAAAATAVEVTSRMGRLYPPPPFTVDKPFFFAIYDTRASVYTFIGKVDDPQP